jgi:hypothetical protein
MATATTGQARGTAERRPAAGEITETMDTALLRIDQAAEQYGIEQTAGLSPFRRAVQIARGIQALRAMLTPEVMQHIMALQGSYLGFRTDKDKQGGYPVEVVRECFIEATLRGFPTGCNCWNIIADRFYATKEGYYHKCQSLPGMTDLKLKLGVPKVMQGGATVEGRADFRLNGQPESVERTFPVRLNAGMGADGAIGKATRKLLKAVHDFVLGTEHTIPDPDEEESPAALPASPAKVEAAKPQQQPQPQPIADPHGDPEPGTMGDAHEG